MCYLLMMLLTLGLTYCTEENIPEPEPTPQPQPEPTPTYTPEKEPYHDWRWDEGNPAVQVVLVNKYDVDTTTKVLVSYYTDDYSPLKLADSASVLVKLKAGDSVAVRVAPHKTLEPGIYRVKVKRDGKNVLMPASQSFLSVKSEYNIAVRPLEIASPHDEQADFAKFWADSKRTLREMNPEWKVDTLTNTSSSFVVMVTARSINNHNDTAGIFRFYYAAPKKAGKYPCYIEFPGYDQQSAAFNTPISGSATQCNVYVCPRGQYINRVSPYKKNKEYTDFVTDGLDSREHFYYHGAFMDAVRAMDYVFAQPAVDTANVFAFGSSQGGALTVAAAALSDHPFAAISICVPFLGDWPDYFRVGSWPVQTMQTTAKNKHGKSKEQLLEMLSYFDTKNLAPLITCPVQEVFNLQDHTCPPHTNLSIYSNLINVPEKEIRMNPTLDHTWPSTWNTQRSTYFRQHKK